MPDLEGFGIWLLNILLWIPQKLYEYLTDSVIDMIDYAFSFCELCTQSGLNTAFAAIPASVMFILSWFKIGSGVTIILSAYTIRFLIRRIPGFG